MIFTILEGSTATLSMIAVLFVFFGLAFHWYPALMCVGSKNNNLPFWLAMFLASPFLLMGPWQPVDVVDLFYILPLMEYLSSHSDSAFFHEIAGGIDRHSGFVYAAGVVSIERILAGLLPVWVAHTIIKTTIITTAIIGMFLVAKKMMGASVFLATVMGGLYAYNNESMLFVTFGIGAAVIPLGVYLVHLEVRTRLFFPAILIFSSIVSTFSSAYHTGPALFVALIGSTLIWRPNNWFRYLAALFIIFAVFLLNWIEVAYALLLNSGQSSRWVKVEGLDISFKLLESIVSLTGASLYLVPIIVLAIVLNFNAMLRKSIIAFAGLFIFIVFFSWLNRGILSETVFARYNPAHLNFGGLDFFEVVLCGAAVIALRESSNSWRYLRPSSLALAGIIATMLGMTVSGQMRLAATFFGKGNIATFARNSNLDDLSWRKDEPVRSVSVPYRLVSNLPIHSGLSTADGRINLVPADYDEFLQLGAFKRDYVSNNSSSELLDGTTVQAGDNINADEILDPQLLGILNVGYVFSVKPLISDGLVLISEPVDSVPRSEQSNLYKLFVRPFIPINLFIYSPKSVLPRIYVGGPVVTYPKELGNSKVLDMVRAYSGLLGTVVEETYADQLSYNETLEIVDYSLNPDGYSIEVNAPNGGILVVNNAWLRWWRAFADGHEINVIPVNKAHFGVTVPPGSKTLNLIYDRPHIYK